MKYEATAISAILAAIIVAIYRLNQRGNRQWHLHGKTMRRKQADGTWETRLATSQDKDEDWWEQQG